MMKRTEQLAMVGQTVADPHKNTAKCGKVNDRLRRRNKRLEKAVIKKQIRSGELLVSRIGRA